MRFDAYHPIINFIYFISVIVCNLTFDHPIYISVAYVVMFAYYIKLRGVKGIKIGFSLIAFAIVYTVIYASYNHFGVTILGQNNIGNNITLESIVYGLSVGIRAITVMMTLGCAFQIITKDKVVYVFGRISPKLSLFIAILFRSVPRVGVRSKAIDIGRKGIGKSFSQGNILSRIRNVISSTSTVVGWTIEDFIDTSSSMKSRGYSLRGRTAYSLYSFDNRDRLFLIVMIFFMVTLWGAWALDYTNIYYDPKIIMPKPGGVDVWLFVVYAGLLIMPLLSEIFSEKRFRHSLDIY
ncbi:MAG: hypothetical protein IJX12_02840 [Lachnospiraceae bacterium]|nr:hypothetical protein [Lachnospiraceae bacterium]